METITMGYIGVIQGQWKRIWKLLFYLMSYAWSNTGLKRSSQACCSNKRRVRNRTQAGRQAGRQWRSHLQ